MPDPVLECSAAESMPVCNGKLNRAHLFVILLALLSATAGLVSCSRQPHPEVLYQQATTAFEQGDLPSALQISNQGETRFRRSSPEWSRRFRVLEAQVLVWQGKSQQSLAVLEESFSPNSVPSEITIREKALQGVANVYLQRFKEGEQRLTEAEQLANAGHPELLGDIYLFKGILCAQLTDYPCAELYARKALRIARSNRQEFLEASALGNLGLSYMRRGLIDAAVESFTATNIIALKLHNKSLSSRTAGNLGWCYEKLGNYDRAIELYTEAESSAKQLGILKYQLMWLNNIGWVHLELHDPTGSEPYLQEALAIARQLGDQSSTAMCLKDLAAVSLKRGKLDAAAQYNHEALRIEEATNDHIWLDDSRQTEALIQQARGNFADAEKLLREVIHDSGEDVSLRWESEATLGEIYAAQKHDSAAEAQFRRALVTVDAARAALTNEEFRLSFLTTASEFYDSYIEFLVEHGRARDALEVAEHSRARTLDEGLGLKLGKASFQPELAARRAHATLLTYWLKADRSFLWVVTPRQVRVVELPPADQIRTAVRDYNKALQGTRDVLETENKTGQQLYAMLVSPAEKQIATGSRVVLVPDDILHTLNFETLLAPRPRLHYWIEDVILTSSPSLELLSSSTDRKPANKNLLLIGNPLTASSDFPPLAHAKLEMQKVQGQFVPTQSTFLEGKQATARAYMSSNTGSYSYIHFVTHGTASRVAPLESSIVLSPDGDDYKLYARDITSRPLHAELVTISACYGAGTRAYTGEGLVGLSWAFLRAGAHNVVAALWEVNDASTPELMDVMYRKLLGGSTPAEALRLAKLEMLHSRGVFRRPFYWGAFQCYTGY